MIDLRETEQGVIFPVKAVPGASRAEIRGIHAGQLKVAVTQVAERGKANTALQKLLAKQLGLRCSEITLVSGATDSEKRFLVTSGTLSQLADKIAEIVAARR